MSIFWGKNTHARSLYIYIIIIFCLGAMILLACGNRKQARQQALILIQIVSAWLYIYTYIRGHHMSHRNPTKPTPVSSLLEPYSSQKRKTKRRSEMYRELHLRGSVIHSARLLSLKMTHIKLLYTQRHMVPAAFCASENLLVQIVRDHQTNWLFRTIRTI